MKKSTHTPEYVSLREQVRSARKSARLSQRELALRLSVPHSWIAKVENGERRLDVLELFRYLLACDVDPLDFLSRWANDLPGYEKRPLPKRRSPK
jgi:transcriptional regulator with XRE-family HTH domain